MRALLLAAGLGTRLRPLTDSLPKCLMPIKGRALLGIWLERLQHAGIGPFLVNTHYLPGLVQSFVETSPYQDSVTLVHEPTLKGTAGTLLQNLDYFQGEDAMLIHADNYCLSDISAFVQAHRHRPAECVMTMITFRTSQPRQCGIVETDDRGVVTAFHEKVVNPPGNIANGGVYILSNELLMQLNADFRHATDFSTQVIPAFVGRIYSYHTTETFIDIGTPESYAAANETH
jgi:mannose-1-phosphate guanylyltransferase